MLGTRNERTAWHRREDEQTRSHRRVGVGRRADDFDRIREHGIRARLRHNFRRMSEMLGSERQLPTLNGQQF